MSGWELVTANCSTPPCIAQLPSQQ